MNLFMFPAQIFVADVNRRIFKGQLMRSNLTPSNRFDKEKTPNERRCRHMVQYSNPRPDHGDQGLSNHVPARPRARGRCIDAALAPTGKIE